MIDTASERGQRMSDERYGDFQPGDRVQYYTGMRGVIIRRCRTHAHDDWLVDWDGRDEPATAKTCNLSHEAA